MRYSFVSTAVCAAVFNAAPGTSQLFDYANFPIYGPAGPLLMSVPGRMTTSAYADIASSTTLAPHQNAFEQHFTGPEATATSTASHTSLPSSNKNVATFFTSKSTSIATASPALPSPPSHRTGPYKSSCMDSTADCQSLVATELRSQSLNNTPHHTPAYSKSREIVSETIHPSTWCSKPYSRPEVPLHNTTMKTCKSGYSCRGPTNPVNTSELQVTVTRALPTGQSSPRFLPPSYCHSSQRLLVFS